MGVAMALGATTWLIPDCFWPAPSEIPGGRYESHESICVLNTGERDAHLLISFYFEDSEPILDVPAFCAARRTHHVRLDRIEHQGRRLPCNAPYAALVVSDVRVSVQYSRCDVSQPNLTLMTTMAHPVY